MGEFDEAFNIYAGFGIVVLDDKQLVGLSVCCPMEAFSNVPGIRTSSNYGEKILCTRLISQ